jgi:ABC-2 type transport system ATP-binding protein
MRKVEELSKGMCQKVQFIVSVLHEPDILVLDEPFAGLDPVSTEALRKAVLDLGKQGKTILLSTHIMEQAERMCAESSATSSA